MIQQRSRGQDNAEAAPLGLYVHVPFCAKTCDFCAFYQISPSVESIARYFRGLEMELALVGRTPPIATVFWGGGTPGLLSPSDIRRLGGLLAGHFGFVSSAPSEWSVELAPASVTEARLEALREIGVTRISLGVQSFAPQLLEAIGRPHTVEQVERAYGLIRAAGFASVNLDLMFALPGQDESARHADVSRAVALEPDHLSTYCLTLEEDTALWLKLSRGNVRRDRDLEAAQYLATWEQLERAGYAQYEVSNFARPGHACRHNLNTWRMNDWIGLGPSAASQQGGSRGSNVADLDRWAADLGRGVRAGVDRVAVTSALRAEDALIFGLRMNEGVDLAIWKPRAPDAPWGAVESLLGRLQTEGLLVRQGARVRLTDSGRLLADAIGGEIMTAFSADVAAA